MNYIRSCLAFSLFFFFCSPSFSINLDGAILLSFRNSILKDPLSVLSNWDYFDATPCLWTGVTCARVASYFGASDVFRVVSLALPNCNLLGTLPEELGFIQYLRVLDLSNNSLNGSLPSSLFNNQELQVLSLAKNEISGVIPESFSGLNGLKFLNLSDNFLFGNVPKSLTSLKNLTVVSLKGNSFSGSVLSGIQSLEFLDLSSNLLNGSLPKDFGGENLSFLNLSSNRISGFLTQEFAAKMPPNATIDLSFNDLVGEIPDSVPLSHQKTEFFSGNTGLCGKQIKKICAAPSASPAIAAVPQITDSTSLQNSSNNGPTPGAMVGIVVGSLAVFILLAVLLFRICRKKKKATSDEHELGKDSDAIVLKESRNLPSWTCSNIEHQTEIQHEKFKIDKKSLVIVDGETKLELETLLKASAYVLGSSVVSIVYKAVLQNGTKPHNPKKHTDPIKRSNLPRGIVQKSTPSMDFSDTIQTNEANPTKQIFILSGQSNMAGRGGVEGHKHWDGVVPPECAADSCKIFRLDAHLRWEVACEPLHHDIDTKKTCGVGPGMSFANAVKDSAGAIGLVPCAVGGTAIKEWARGSHLYDNMVKRAKSAADSGGEIKAVLWYQGESDTASQHDVDCYKEKMEQLIHNVRADLGLPSLPIIQVAITSGDIKYLEKIREIQKGIDIPNVVCVDAKGLQLKGDKLHLTTEAQVKLGHSLAQAYLAFSPIQH